MRKSVISGFVVLFLLCAGTPAWSLTRTNPFTIGEGKVGFAGSFDGSNYLVGLQDTTAGPTGTIYAQMISRTGARIGEPISNGRTGSFPLIAFDGTNYLMVWADAGADPADIYGQFISKTGELVGDAFQVEPGQGIDSRPMIAYGNGTYLVVWTIRSDSVEKFVYGRTVSTEGTLGDLIDISASTGKDPWVAFDGTNFLVVWNDAATTVLGQFIDPQGQKVDPSGQGGSSFIIDDSPQKSDNPTYLIFDGTRYVASIPDEILSGENESTGLWAYYARAISTTGEVSDTPIRLDNGNATGPFGGIAGFDGTNYLAVIHDAGQASVTPPSIKAMFFNTNFEPIGDWTTIFNTVNSQAPVTCTLLFDGGRYLAISPAEDFVSSSPEMLSAGMPNTYGMFIQALGAPTLTSFGINGVAATSNSRSVTLNNQATDSPTHYMASESPAFTGAAWLPYSQAPAFTLSPGGGAKTVYLKLKNDFGESFIKTDSIKLLASPLLASFVINGGAATTASRTVGLNPLVLGTPTHYMASESATFAGAVWKAWTPNPAFILSAALGNKTVYFKVKNAVGQSAVKQDVIYYGLRPVVKTFLINNGAAATNTPLVKLNNTAANSPTQYMASLSPTFAGAVWRPWSVAPGFSLGAGYGVKRVYFKTRNALGESAVRSDTITFVPNVAGSYSGRIYNNEGAGPLKVTISQSGATLTCSVTTYKGTCPLKAVTFKGQVDANGHGVITGTNTCQGQLTRIRIEFGPSGNSLVGAFTAFVGRTQVDSGNFTLNRL